jgi:hypothetical protein
MERVVVSRRHVSIGNGLRDLAELLSGGLRIRGVVRPFRKIQPPPPGDDVVLDEPGKRRERAIPRPSRLIGVAVVTGFPQKLLNRMRGHEVASNRRIGALDPHGLRGDHDDTEAQQ